MRIMSQESKANCCLNLFILVTAEVAGIGYSRFNLKQGGGYVLVELQTLVDGAQSQLVADRVLSHGAKVINSLHVGIVRNLINLLDLGEWSLALGQLHSSSSLECF